jgi:hypothetical protein
MANATNKPMDEETERHMRGWNGFVRFLTLSLAGIVVTLALMAIFLI